MLAWPVGSITFMLTAGVDLAAEPKGTALAVIEWSSGLAILRELHLGVSDEPIVDVASRVDKLGIDCALGWPREFIAFINAQADLSTPSDFDGGMDWRRRLSYRETDRQVREITGRWPLSVSTDRLGLTAMRAAGLLSKMAKSGLALDRTGEGLVAEIYPGASLRLWGFDTQGYRASAEVRETLLSSLHSSAPWFEVGEHAPQMIASCDAFDAVIAALATRAVAVGRVHKPDVHQRELAAVEGWINLPKGTLNSLID
jgi:predicted nuclease with RNAse H fold